MKNILLSTLFTVATVSVSAQDPNQPIPGQAPQIAVQGATLNPEFVQFKEVNHDFGNIRQNSPPSFTFEFKNVGNKDITLVNVQASCGCTTPNWKGGIYKAGESGQITATFNAASEGFFSKNITVTTSEGIVMLTISGTVLNPAAFDAWKHQQDSISASTQKSNSGKKPAKKSGKSSKKAKSSADADKPKSTQAKRGS